VRRYTYVELGFKDERKGDLPNLLWELLFYFAEYDGKIDKRTPIPFGFKQQLKKSVQRLRKLLKEIFNITENPIDYSYKSKAYTTRFKIKDLSYGKGE